MRRLSCVMLFLLLLLLTTTAQAATISLAWAPGTAGASATTGYKIYYGTVSGLHPSSVDVGLVLAGGVSGLTVGTTYYFAVVAYNADGESVKSAEVAGVAQDNAIRPVGFSATSYPR